MSDDAKLAALPPRKTDVADTLRAVLEMADSLECVQIVGIFRDGAQLLRGSTSSGPEKAFMFQFHQAYISKWFRLGDDT